MKKGLRPEARHLILDRLFEHFPDEEGIKTSGQSMTSSSDGFEHFPDEEGIKTRTGVRSRRMRDVRTLP